MLSVRGGFLLISFEIAGWCGSSTTVISTVQSNNVPRVNKSYEAFGNGFTTTIVDDLANDLATSDLS